MAPPSTPPRKPASPTPTPATKPKPVRVLPGAIPGAAPAVGDLFTASGRNPFRVTGPAVVSFSGGRTSGMLLRKVLDAYGGTLPDDIHVVFANTGAEDTRTLDFVAECAERWGVNIRWLEYDPDALVWWAEKERETGRRFIFKEPEGYAGTIRRAHLRVIADNEARAAAEARGAPTHAPGTGEPLDPEYGPEDFASIPCDCTERRAPPLPCVCPSPRPTRGEGHTIVCAALRAEARTPGPAGWAVREAHERHHTGGQRMDRAWRLSDRGEYREWMGELAAQDRAAWERAAEEADLAARALPPPTGPA